MVNSEYKSRRLTKKQEVWPILRSLKYHTVETVPEKAQRVGKTAEMNLYLMAEQDIISFLQRNIC